MLELHFRIHPYVTVARPYACVQLARGGRHTLWTSHVIVDSGATISLFPRSFIEGFLPPLDFSSGSPNRRGVAWRGTTFHYWIHNVEIRVKGDPHPVQKTPIIAGNGDVGFWDDVTSNNGMFPPYPILGQQGALEYLVFTEFAGQKKYRLEVDVNVQHPWIEK